MKNTLIMDTLQGCIYSNQIVSEQNEEDILSIRVENASANPKLDIYLGNEYAETIDMELSEDATATLEIPKKYYQKGNMLKVRFKDDNAVYKFMHFIHDAKIGKGLRVEKVVNTVFRVKFDEIEKRLGYLELTYELPQSKILYPFGGNKYSSDKLVDKIFVNWGDGSTNEYSNVNGYAMANAKHKYENAGNNVTITASFEGVKELSYFFCKDSNQNYMSDLLEVKGEFQGIENCTYENWTFYGCNKLKKIDKNIFVNGTNLKQWYSTFNGTAIEDIPEDMFSYAKGTDLLLELSAVFRGTNIKTIPKNLLKGLNLKKVHDLFLDCKNLSEIPSGLFDGCNASHIYSIFDGCTGLETYPIDLFDHLDVSEILNGNRSDNKLWLVGIFRMCTNLKGNVRDFKSYDKDHSGKNFYAVDVVADYIDNYEGVNTSQINKISVWK